MTFGFSIVRPVVLVARGARLDQALVDHHNALYIALLCRGVALGGGVEHQLCVRHPLLLVAGAAGHHQQVGGLSDHQRLAFEHCPFAVGLGRARFDVKQRVRCRVDDLDHQIAHGPDVTRRRPRRRGGLCESGRDGGSDGQSFHAPGVYPIWANIPAHGGLVMRVALLLFVVATAAAPLAAQAPAPQTAPAAEVTPNDYGNEASWLCRPGRKGDACDIDLTTTVIGADGTMTREAFTPNPKAPIDCFYVYPTVSTDPGVNSDMIAD